MAFPRWMALGPPALYVPAKRRMEDMRTRKDDLEDARNLALKLSGELVEARDMNARLLDEIERLKIELARVSEAEVRARLRYEKLKRRKP
jgi:hypothetical protein